MGVLSNWINQFRYLVVTSETSFVRENIVYNKENGNFVIFAIFLLQTKVGEFCWGNGRLSYNFWKFHMSQESDRKIYLEKRNFVVFFIKFSCVQLHNIKNEQSRLVSKIIFIDVLN